MNNSEKQTTNEGASNSLNSDSTEIFISYAHVDRPIIENIVIALKIDGHHIWWDKHLNSGEVFAHQIEEKLLGAAAVVVAWSSASRRSVWVQGEALAALDEGKLVQIMLDTNRPPIPFNALHAIDFSKWNGKRHSDDVIFDLSTSLENVTESRSRIDYSTSWNTKPKNLVGSPIAASISSWMATIAAISAPALSAFALAGVRYNFFSTDLFSAIAAMSFAASGLAATMALLRWKRIDTTEYVS